MNQHNELQTDDGIHPPRRDDATVRRAKPTQNYNIKHARSSNTINRCVCVCVRGWKCAIIGSRSLRSSATSQVEDRRMGANEATNNKRFGASFDDKSGVNVTIKTFWRLLHQLHHSSHFHLFPLRSEVRGARALAAQCDVPLQHCWWCHLTFWPHPCFKTVISSWPHLLPCRPRHPAWPPSAFSAPVTCLSTSALVTHLLWRLWLADRSGAAHVIEFSAFAFPQNQKQNENKRINEK